MPNRLAPELLDRIAFLCEPRVAITLQREYVKRKLLSQLRKDTVRDWDHAQWLYQYNVQGDWANSAYALCAIEGDAVRMKWMDANYPCVERATALILAIQHNQLPIATYLCELGVQNFHACRLAAEKGDLPVVELLHSYRQHDVFSFCSLQVAACEGHVEVLRYLFTKFRPFIRRDNMRLLVAESIANDHIDILRYLITQGAVLTHYDMDLAAEYGFLDILMYLHDVSSAGCTYAAMDYAAGLGRLDIVRFLHENRTEGCSQHAIKVAAASGHVPVVRYLLRERLVNCTKEAVDLSASNGHLGVIYQFATRAPTFIDQTTVIAAATSGHAEVVMATLDVLRTHRPTEEDQAREAALNSAADNGRVNVVARILQFQRPRNMMPAFQLARSAYETHFLRYLRNIDAAKRAEIKKWVERETALRQERHESGVHEDLLLNDYLNYDYGWWMAIQARCDKYIRIRDLLISKDIALYDFWSDPFFPHPYLYNVVTTMH